MTLKYLRLEYLQNKPNHLIMILGWRFMAFSGCPTVMTERCLLISFSYFLISHFSLFKTKAILLIKNGKQYHFFSSNFSFIFFSSNCLAGDSHSTTKGLENSNSGKLLLEILNIFRLDAWRNSLHSQETSGQNYQYLLISFPSSRIYPVFVYVPLFLIFICFHTHC